MAAKRVPLKMSFGVIAGLVLAGVAIFFTEGLNTYSTLLFFWTPAIYGLATALLYGRIYKPEPREVIGQVMYSALVPAGVACLAMLAVAKEGIICLIMAAPLVGLEILIGAAVGRAIYDMYPGRRAGMACLAIVPLAYSGVFAYDRMHDRAGEFHPITTSIEIAAAPEVVWKNVVSFSDLPAPKHWLFKTGIAYPMRARIVGTGPGAVRYCDFTTGPFVEPIDVWDAPNLLRFRVVSNPAPMKEASPWGDIHPPHLEGFMESRQGEFRLVRLANGGTRLEGTTWYRHGLGPEWYWTVWSDYIIHTIHTRVLLHIKALSEGAA